MKFQAAAINMNIYIGGGLECGGHSKEETSRQDMILCEIIKILVNIIPFLRRLKTRAERVPFLSLILHHTGTAVRYPWC